MMSWKVHWFCCLGDVTAENDKCLDGTRASIPCVRKKSWISPFAIIGVFHIILECIRMKLALGLYCCIFLKCGQAKKKRLRTHWKMKMLFHDGCVAESVSSHQWHSCAQFYIFATLETSLDVTGWNGVVIFFVWKKINGQSRLLNFM